MRHFLPVSVWHHVPKLVMPLGFVLLFSSHAVAGPAKSINAYATGAITAQEFCSETEVCQEAHVTGTATRLGRFVGVLLERVDITNGTYTGTGVFTTSDGSTIRTEYTGEVTPPASDGRVFFVESHHFTGGTGQWANASGDLQVYGTADGAGQVQIVGTGTLSK